MAAMVTALTEFATNGDSRTYTTAGHTVGKPKLVIQKRRVPVGKQTVAETICSVIHGTEDSAGDSLPSKVAMSVTVRTPVDGIAADVTAALAILRDLVAGDEFGNAVTTQEFLK